MGDYWAERKGMVGWTMKEFFWKGDPTAPEGRWISALSPNGGPYANFIFLYGVGFARASSDKDPRRPFFNFDPATIGHEVFHKLGVYDGDFYEHYDDWGLDRNHGSRAFTKYFKEKCF